MRYAYGHGYDRLRLNFTGASVPPVSYDPDAEILFGAMVPPPDTARKAVISALIEALKAAGIWAKLDILYLFAAHAEQPGTLNWKDPASFAATPVQSPLFTVDRGFTGNPGASAYLAPGWTANVHAVQLQQNSAHISAWSLSPGSASSTQRLIGTSSGTPPRFMLIPLSTGNIMDVMINDGAQSPTFGSPARDGFFIANRNGASTRRGYRNGIVIAQDTVASTGRSSSGLTFLRDFTNFASLQIAQGSAGAALTEPEADAFYNALSTYLQAVGAV